MVSGEEITQQRKNREPRLAHGKMEIKKRTYAEGWELEPDYKERLEGEVPRDVVEDDTEREGFEEVEEAKDDPVGEPLYVIMGGRGFNGFEREVGG